MDGTIGRLSNRIRIFSSIGDAGAAEARLNRVAREQLTGAIAGCLDQVLDDDQTVYVIRRLRVQMTCNLELSSDAGLARLWGRSVAVAVLQEIHGSPDTERVVRFRNRPEFVAHFIADLLRGEAWDRWYYSSFNRLRSMNLPAALASLLESDRESLPALLAALDRLNSLEELLGAIDKASLAGIWRRTRENPANLDSAALRYLFDVALAIAGRLGFLRRDGRRFDRTGEASVDLPVHSSPAAGLDPAESRSAAAGSMSDLMAAYTARHATPADWRDSASLSAAIAAILRFLLRQGAIAAPPIVSAPSPGELVARLREFDWLDLPCLAASILDILREIGAPEEPRPLPVRPRAALTPRQKLLLDHLLAVLKERPSAAGAAFGRSTAHADAFRLYAWLVSRFEQWASDELAESFCDRLAAAVAGETRARNLIAALGESGSQVLADACRVLGAVLPAAASPALAQEWIETRAAGIFLLVRAILDAHLQRASALAYPAELWSSLVAAIALRWAGEEYAGGALDPGIALFSGLDVAMPAPDLPRCWSRVEAAAHHRFQAALFGELAAHRLFSGSALHLYRLGTIIGGSPDVWCFGRLREESDEIGDAWLGLWDGRYGTVPEVVEAGSGALPAALDAFAKGSLGVPLADLTFALAAGSLLRLWARWLPRFSSSTNPYLLRNFVRRPGRIRASGDLLYVELESLPLDVVLEMSGYTSITPPVPWLGGRRIGFDIGGR